MRTFNVRYKQRRQAAAAQGKPFSPCKVARVQLRQVLFAGLAKGEMSTEAVIEDALTG